MENKENIRFIVTTEMLYEGHYDRVSGGEWILFTKMSCRKIGHMWKMAFGSEMGWITLTEGKS